MTIKALLIFLGLLLTAAWPTPDPAAAIIRKQLERPGTEITSVRVAGSWAVVQGVQGDSGGYTVLRFVDGRWRPVAGSGGVLSAEHAHVLGVPFRDWQSLGMAVSQAQRREILSAGPHWSFLTARQELEDATLSGYSAYELTLMRNEIFAVHGRPFQDPLLRQYFNSRPWYRANPAYNDSLLSDLERRNAARILSYQRAHNMEL
jgi:hypothetical protein